MTFVTALSLSLIVVAIISATVFSYLMRSISLGQRIRDYGPRLHESKSGTPTMGGVVIISLWGIAFLVLSLAGRISQQGLFIFSSAISFGGIGLIDDLISQHCQRSLGLLARQKIVISVVVSLVLFFAFPSLFHIPIRIPFSSLSLSLPRPLFFFLLCWVFLSTTNSMNLTDGLDGLAAGVSIIILGGFVVAFHSHETLAAVLPLIGILVGFMWMNMHPARLFLGDVGAFALGGAIGGLALATGTALVLPLLAGVLVLESTSVIAQIAYYRLTGRRIFKIAPFHHHFEHADGIDYPHILPNVEWPEEKIVTRIWIMQVVFTSLGLLALYR
jgi:phospho-N-acetylmuramoyl-pentapeptide-transferase